MVTGSASRTYNGSALTASGSVSGLVNGETVAFAVTGSQTAVGMSPNSYRLEWTGTVKESNYEVKESVGTLTVTQRTSGGGITPTPTPRPDPAPAPAPAPQAAPAAEKPALKPQAPKEEEISYTNIMQVLVEEKAPRYIKKFGICTCKQCEADVKALTLTNLVPKYVVLSKLDRIPMLTVYEGRYNSTIFAQLTRSCKIVMDHPHHNR